jgi:hypothetical protein
MMCIERTPFGFTSLRNLGAQLFLLFAVTILLAGAAWGQVWVGPSVGLDSPVFEGERNNQVDPGVGLDVNIRLVKQFDLVLGLYLSDLTFGNDADPIPAPTLGMRWRKLLGNPQSTFCPFVAFGGGFLCVEAEAGLEIAPRSSIGLETGIRERFSSFNSVQAFALMRIRKLRVK